jgi:hypothetical protein
MISKMSNFLSDKIQKDLVPKNHTHHERRGGRTGEKSVTLILRKNRPVQHTFEI